MQLLRLLGPKADVVRSLIKRYEDKAKEIGYNTMRLRESAATNGSTTALGTTANNTTSTAATAGDGAIPEQDEVKVHHEVTLYLGDIQDHILTMLQNVNHYDLILGRAHRNYLGQISIELSQAGNTTNEVINRLTFFATVIVPLVGAFHALIVCSTDILIEPGWRFVWYECSCSRSKQRRFGVVLLDCIRHVVVCCGHGSYWKENRLPLDFYLFTLDLICINKCSAIVILPKNNDNRD